MALSPLTPYAPRIEIVEPDVQPFRTYEFNFDTGEFAGTYVDGLSAVKQMIAKALYTPRFQHIIYSTDYGSELESLIGSEFSGAFLEAEIERYIKEAILDMYDNVVTECNSFVFRHDGDETYVEFNAVTDQGIIEMVVRTDGRT